MVILEIEYNRTHLLGYVKVDVSSESIHQVDQETVQGGVPVAVLCRHLYVFYGGL